MLVTMLSVAFSACADISGKNPDNTVKNNPEIRGTSNIGEGKDNIDAVDTTKAGNENINEVNAFASENIKILSDYLFGEWGGTGKKDFVLIKSYEELLDLYEFIKESDYYTMRQGEGAYADYLSGRYDASYFADGGCLAAIPVQSSSGSYTYYTYSEKAVNRLTIHVRRRNQYITVSTDDIGYFIYLEPIIKEYDESLIDIVRDHSTSATHSSMKTEPSSINFAGLSSGNYNRYDGKPYYTEAFIALNWAQVFESDGWIYADGVFIPEEAIRYNREKIPPVKAADQMEFVFAESLNISKTEFLVFDIHLESEKFIESLSELRSLPEGAYYLVCRVTTKGITIDGTTETAEYFVIFLVDVINSLL